MDTRINRETFLKALSTDPYANADLIADYMADGGGRGIAELLDTIDSGYELGEEGNPYVAAFRGPFYHQARRRWANPTTFEDDTKFANTRFHIATSFWSDFAHDEPEKFAPVFNTAAGQVERMLTAGRMELRALSIFQDFAVTDEPKLAAFIFAHDDAAIGKLEYDMGRTDGSWRTHGIDGKAISLITGRILHQTAQVTRQQLFRDHWLRAVISPTEYDEVKDLSATLLRELYPAIWDAGYAGHRSTVQSKG